MAFINNISSIFDKLKAVKIALNNPQPVLDHPDIIAPVPRPPQAGDAEARIDAMIARTVKIEGDKYTETTGDRGGATKDGVTLKYLKGVGISRGDLDRDGDIDKDDVRLVTPAIAEKLYKQDFYLDPRINRLPEPLQPVVFDAGVNSGPPRAIILLQKALRAELGVFFPADGVIGPATRAKAEEAVAKFGAAAVVGAVVDARIAWYNAIVREDPVQEKFLRGWIARANSFRI